jgi:hypothetical protein
MILYDPLLNLINIRATKGRHNLMKLVLNYLTMIQEETINILLTTTKW